MKGLYLKDKFTHNTYQIVDAYKEDRHFSTMNLEISDLNGSYITTISIKELFNGQYDLFSNSNDANKKDYHQDNILINGSTLLPSFTAQSARAKADRYHKAPEIIIKKISKAIEEEASNGEYSIAVDLEPDLSIDIYNQIKQAFIDTGYTVEPYNNIANYPLRCFSKDGIDITGIRIYWGAQEEVNKGEIQNG